MDVKISANHEARRVTIWTDAETSPADLGKALDSVLHWPDFRPGISLIEIFRGPAGPEAVTRAMRALGHRARRLGLRRWAIVAADSNGSLPHRTWAGIAGAMIVKVAAFDSPVAAIDWLNADDGMPLDTLTPAPVDANNSMPSRRSKFNSPSATGFHPAPFLTKSDAKDVSVNPDKPS